MPRPANPCAPVCRTITSNSIVLIPNAIRWAASPDNVAATLGVPRTVRSPCNQPVATA